MPDRERKPRKSGKWERLAFSGLLGAGLTWLALLETGLAHRWDAGAWALDLLILAACWAGAFAFLTWWERRQ